MTLDDVIVGGEHRDEDAVYAPEKFDDYRAEPVRDWMAWNEARAEFPDNFEAD